METVRTVDDLRSTLGGRRVEPDAPSVGLVPTMGFLHAGHISLLERARAECDTVVMSLFVNPTQFAPGEDLDSYPRDEDRDAELAAGAGVDILFAPAREVVYPTGFATSIEVSGLTEVLCGHPDSRGREHFRGVTTVVGKLLNMVGPDRVYFGQKDAQQALVVERMVADLDFPVTVLVCPTVREPDGLAMSSRNAYLAPVERERALALSRALRAADRVVTDGQRSASAVLGAAHAVLDEAGVAPDYVELRSARDLAPVDHVNGSTLLAIAAQIGPARLIDNTILGDSNR